MTRINANIPVKNLTDQHLLAEHREIKRITDAFTKRMAKGSLKYIPLYFTLGLGHVNFFLDKGLFTWLRYKELYNECKNRGFNVSYYADNWACYANPKSNLKHFEHWTGDENIKRANKLIIDRITERITNSKQIPRYYGKAISKEEAINLLKQ